MNLSEDEIIENYGKNLAIEIEIHYFHMNMSGNVCHVGSMLSNENKNSQKYKEKT